MTKPRTKKLRQLNESDFQRVFQEVRADINDLDLLHNKVLIGVLDQLSKYRQLSINFPGFFSAFLSAMHTDLIIRLGRIYDPEGTGHDSCTLARCLSVLRDSTQFFTDSAITARLSKDYRASNPNFLSLNRPDLKQIESDLGSIEKSRKRLIKLRHKVYAHKDLETVLSGKRDEFLTSYQEVTDLIELAHAIWNRHSSVWSPSTYTAMCIGEDDYKWLFSSLRRGMKFKHVVDNHKTERFIKRIQAQKNRESS